MGENLNTFAQYRDRLTPGEKMEPNTGKVIRRGMFKVAAYCDDNEELNVCSAICPHLDGIVRWNDVEKTWDCPCHGSRFSPTGEVLNGPTDKGLQSIKENNI